MEQLLEKIQREHWISEEKSLAILITIKEYTKEKFALQVLSTTKNIHFPGQLWVVLSEPSE